MKKYFSWIILLVAIVSLSVSLVFLWHSEEEVTPEFLHIAIPYEEDIFFINESDYLAWLSEEIGMDVKVSFLQPSYTDGYLKQILNDPNTDYDAVFFTKRTAPSKSEMENYIASGGLTSLDAFIDGESVYLAQSLVSFSQYDLRKELSHTDGKLYYMPALDNSAVAKSAQTMWVNVNLLEDVGLTIPSTTEDFTEMLRAFKDYDENMAPMIGSGDADYFFPLYFLMNSFVTCDAQNHFLYVEDGEILFAPASDGWREGLKYCHELYEEGLMPEEVFTYSEDSFIAICNDLNNLVGCFTTDSIASVLSENSPALLSRYLAVAPLGSGHNIAVALERTPLPRVGGIVLSSSEYQDEVFALMDLMCSEEAYLRGHYGTPEIDWTTASPEDITVSGDKAVITITQSVGTLSDTDSAHVIGPYIASESYADMVAWKGFQVNQSAYLDARAYRTYENYAPEETLPYLQLSAAITEDLDAFVWEAMVAFVRGEWDIESEEAWEAYLEKLSHYCVEDLVAQGERLYGERESGL